MAGQPPFKPTAAHRRDVESMKADAWSNDRIARIIGISRPTLEKHFAEELEHGRDRVQLEALRALRKLAKKNASANSKLIDRIAVAGTLRREPGEPKAPALGKKASAQLAASNPDRSTEMGEMLARRARKLN